MRQRMKQFIGVLLSLTLLLGLVSVTSLKARADSTIFSPASTYTGFGDMVDSDETVRIEGVKYETMDGSEFIRWYVIGYNESLNTVTLFSRDILSLEKYNYDSTKGNDYTNSYIKEYVEGLINDGEPLASVNDALANIRVIGDPGLSGAVPYLLSDTEVNDISNFRIQEATDNSWWLRTPGNGDRVTTFTNDKYGYDISYDSNPIGYAGVRPAIQLDLSAVSYSPETNMFYLEPPKYENRKDIAECTVSGLSAKAWTGSAIIPVVTVKDGSKTLEKGTDYTVSFTNNISSGKATATIRGKGQYAGIVSKTFAIKKASLKYRAYVQKNGWMNWSTAGIGTNVDEKNYAGTTDDLRMETIQMQLTGVSGAVKYRAYVQKMGWTQWATTADKKTYAGTKGMSRRIEMIQLSASGQITNLYDMYYRTYCEKFGWLGWAGNKEKSGSAGYARKLEAFQIQLVPKGTAFDKGDVKAFYDISEQ